MSTILTSSQQTFVDITDQRKLSAYITSSLPKTQSEDPNVLPHTYAPNWSSTKLTLTPVLFLDQTNLPLNTNGLSISWKRKDGTSTETTLTTGEIDSKGILTVNQNKLGLSDSGMITYICYISFFDDETKNTVNISADITFTLVKNAENAKLAYVTADTYVFKYNTSSALIGATQSVVSAQVQGVSIAKWQYKNSSGVWVDYPTTSDNGDITSGTLVVKPTHAVFFNSVAQIKLVTDEADVFDTITITKIYDGAKGQTGQTGSEGKGGISIILANESVVIPCTSGGSISSNGLIEIPFYAYVGTQKTACSCEIDEDILPSGMELSENTPSTANDDGYIEFSLSSGAPLDGDNSGVIELVFTAQGKTITKHFSWAKSKQGKSGTNAVVFSVYAPNGTIVQNQSGSLTLSTTAYSGSMLLTTGKYQWSKYIGGKWEDISGATTSQLIVSGEDIVNIQSYRCTMTYSNKSYVDVITVEDKSDSYVSEMLSIGGFTVKNNQGGLVPYVIVRTNQREVDELLGPISETAPSSPKANDLWYKIDHTAKSVTLMKYSGSAWANATESQSLTYTWYKQDKDGNSTEFNKQGKVIYLSADDIDSIATLQCDITK